MKQELRAWATATQEELCKKLSTSTSGLTSHEAEKRLAQYGPNRILANTTSPITIIKRQFTSPFIYLLLAASITSFLLKQFDDGIIILLFIGINAVLGFYQEFKSEKTVALLQKYIESKVNVLRDGKEQALEISKLAPGDVIKFIPGDSIPADVRFIETTDLQVNESVVTGESVSVTKTPSPQPSSEGRGNLSNIGLCASTIVSGEALGVVIATGNQSSYGDIAVLTSKVKHVSTFEARLAKMSKFTLIIVSVTLVFVFILNIVLHEAPNIIELAVFSVALAVSVIPEALPVVTTFSLSLGALHLAKKHVVVKRLSAIEDVGSIEILCSDKTGTLTENILKLADTIGDDTTNLLAYARVIAERPNKKNYHGNNSFDEAIIEAATHRNIPNLSFAILKKIPFDPLRKRVTIMAKSQEKTMLVTMGAPETIVPETTLSDEQKSQMDASVKDFGTQGKRVLAVAYKDLSPHHEEADLEQMEDHLSFLGLLSFEDPIKPTTKSAIIKAGHLGLQVKILTGDGREVAGHVAHTIGLITDPKQVITGEELENLSEKKQKEAVHAYHVFARVTPEQKYRIIELLKMTHSVGFLGEGINDAPALKIANVAMVVADASAIAREAADIVLLKKSLSVIVDGITEGRVVFANTSKYVLATLSANFGNFFAVATSSLLMSSLPLLPIHILLLNLLSDFPMISVSTDHVDTDDIASPSQFNMHRFALMALLLGIVSTFFDFVFFGVFIRQGTATLQSAWFMGSILTELLFIFSIRTNKFFLKTVRPSSTLVLLTIVAAVVTFLIPTLPFTRELFHFSPIMPQTLLIVVGIVLMYFISTEGMKLLFVHFEKQGKNQKE